MGRKLVNKYELSEELSKHIDDDTGIVLIGSTLVWWDKTAPMIGSILKDKYKIPNVYGTYDNPVHALNLNEVLSKIKHNKILAIDSCVCCGKRKVGDILYGNIPLNPGAGVNKDLPKFGDYSILAVTIRQEKAIMGNYSQYGSIKEENIIYSMAVDIAWAINEAYKNII